MRQSPLTSPEGDLVSVKITVDPRSIEPLLDSLSSLSLAIQPQLRHQACPNAGTVVEFPAYASWLPRIRPAASLARAFEVSPMLTGV